jgi:hypothetical protein
MSWSCVRIASLLGQRPEGLSTRERLAIEDHLAGCLACRETARLGDTLRRLAETAQRQARTGSIERAVSRGLLAANEHAQPHRTRSIVLRGIGALAGIVVAAAVALFVFDARDPHDENAGRGDRTDSPPSGDRIVAGRVLIENRVRMLGDAVRSGVSLRADGTAEIVLAHARITLAAGAEVVWDAERATVSLRDGSIDVAVDPRAKRAFRVTTARFMVDVLGTRFRVDADSVTVVEGRVRVSDLAGAVLADSLAPGAAWRVPNVPVAAREDTRQELRDPAPRREPPPVRVQLHLERARGHLARRDTTAARRELDIALTGNPTRRERADAALLRAECAFIDGDSAGAVRLYLAVHAQHADSVAGETALFAAARLEARAGHHAAARDLLARYLERYPEGSFRVEATTRLGALEDQP